MKVKGIDTSRAQKMSPEDFLVTGLEKIEPAYAHFPGKMYAGRLPSDHDDRHGEMMFWMFEPDIAKIPDTMVIWLNGGPGCSSFNCGVMMEHSPVTQPLMPAGYCCLEDDPPLGYNKYTWAQSTTMLYVEQPIGTGFSTGFPLPENEADVSSDLYAFMQNFYQVFPHLQPNKFFVMGESYAGMFLPSIGHYFNNENKRIQSDLKKGIHTTDLEIPLGGIGIGNGWMNAFVQGPAVIDYSWMHGLIDEPTRDSLHIEFQRCMARMGDPDEVEPSPFHPFNVQDDCGMMWGVLEAAGNPNAYDITTWDPNVDQITFTSEKFYNSPAIKEALHAPDDVVWHGCQVGEGRRRMMDSRRLYMDNDRPINVVPYVADLLNDDIPVVVYNGDRDMTTNMVGSELLLNRMDWKGQDNWLDADRGLWMVDDYEAGWVKEHLNLTFIVVYNSGHMVPYNQPRNALDLLERFLQHESFMDAVQPTVRVPGAEVELGKIKGSDTFQPFFIDSTVGATTTTTAVGSVSSSGGDFGTMAVSFLAGIMATVAFKWITSRNKKRSSYDEVASTEMMG